MELALCSCALVQTLHARFIRNEVTAEKKMISIGPATKYPMYLFKKKCLYLRSKEDCYY
jgi:hypothetical protein